ncbi:NAD(P)H-hydrate dehydratase [Paenibacillus doosanensis]|uniref:Bifunctional NAD(P)H-hydrate repair enzyme n=1 Tax=Paenibacillus konkukensis TaxID=2020716 RepID=A0ABY4RUC1_9BACL|nr:MULTISPECIES: NAD(P)H-hydrate dehydratase [Paenibacillus]MCS7460988.1 NAD(P)H-hydrate dehydratase [Paenibacillus doosanensis]UQZ85658.1 Bifunctional NAD(P)H-hydrate repair enzyme Nnr [Paenibacillus konkukensis]
MYVVNSDEMRNLDRYTIETIGIPANVLMENAGREVARRIETLFSRTVSADGPARWVILAGKGNNGGDGLVIARHLLEAGFEAEVVYAEAPERMASADAVAQRRIIERLGIPARVYGAEPLDWRAYDGIVDALLGVGAAGAPRGPYAALIREANASGLPIVAVDLPSGLDADTGAVHEPCIRAKLTVALAFLKRGLMQYPGADYAGQVVCAPIGIPAKLADELGVQTYVLNESVLRRILGVDPAMPRRQNTHKGTYGHALIAAGSRRMSGAALLSAKSALRAGCGLVTLAVPDRLLDSLIGQIPELMLAAVPDGGTGEWGSLGEGTTAPAASHDGSDAGPSERTIGAAEQALLSLAEGKQAMLIGPGMGRFPGDSAWLRAAWESVASPLVIDADALNMLADAQNFAAWPRRPSPTVLTPHPGEMARLAGVSTPEVQHDRIGLARRYAMKHGVTLVLKGARTVVATAAGSVYINVNGNPGMATGGSGDVLAGIIASLLAQGFTAEQAAGLGVYLHGAAGDRAQAQRRSTGSMLAGDIADML